VIKRALSALLALLIAAGPAAAGDFKVAGPVDAPGVTPITSNVLIPGLGKTVTVPDLPAVPNGGILPYLPQTAIPNIQTANDDVYQPQETHAPSLLALNQALAPQTLKQPKQDAPKAGEAEAASQGAKFDGSKIDESGSVAPAVVPQIGPRWRSVALAIMAAGSLNLSRSATVGRKWFAPADMTNQQVAAKSESNFRKAAIMVVDHAKDLPLNQATAITLNKTLTEGLVPADIHGDPHYHTDTYIFYNWLESPETQQLARDNPVEMASLLHYKMSRLDSFPDGNGRLARLMADLALIKGGYAPVFYSDMKDYFERGNHRSKVTRETRDAYFREMVQRGQAAMSDPTAFKRSLYDINGLDPDLQAELLARDGQQGAPALSRKVTHPKKAPRNPPQPQ